MFTELSTASPSPLGLELTTASELTTLELTSGPQLGPNLAAVTKTPVGLGLHEVMWYPETHN